VFRNEEIRKAFRASTVDLAKIVAARQPDLALRPPLVREGAKRLADRIVGHLGRETAAAGSRQPGDARFMAKLVGELREKLDEDVETVASDSAHGLAWSERLESVATSISRSRFIRRSRTS